MSTNYLFLAAAVVLICAYFMYYYKQKDVSKLQAKKEKVVVIDCRNKSEWDRGHVNIGKVLHIPLPQLETSHNLPKDKNTPIMIHCAVSSLILLHEPFLEFFSNMHFYHL